MRTEKQFSAIHHSALYFIRMHNKHVWIVPCEDEYRLSVIKPEADELPLGTAAILVGTPIENNDYTIHDTIKSSKTIFES